MLNTNTGGAKSALVACEGGRKLFAQLRGRSDFFSPKGWRAVAGVFIPDPFSTISESTAL